MNELMEVFGGGAADMLAPLTGDGYREWSDRLRDVEEMLESPDLQSRAAAIRDRMKAVRREMKRHSSEPNWDLVKLQIAEPLDELQDLLAEELLRRTSDDALVPLDRNPVPAEFEKQVQRYYERLGGGR